MNGLVSCNLADMRHQPLVLQSVFFAALCFLPLPVEAVEYGVNLIVNGNAEQGANSPTGDPVTVPGWTTSSAFTVVDYKQPGDNSGFPNIFAPAPPDRGKQFFAGGFGAAANASQDIDVSANAADIDAGQVVCDISAWLGGFLSDDDNARLTVTFRKDPVTDLGPTLTVGPVTAAQRFNQTGFRHVRTATTTVPAQTRSIHVELVMTRTSGSFDDGYADSLSIVLRKPTLVTTAADSGPGSLRDALSKGNTITFDPSIFASAQIINLSAALPVIVGDTTIMGPGASLLTVRRSTALNTPLFGVFRIANDGGLSPGPTAVLAGLTISNGYFGIQNEYSQLMLDGCVVEGNSNVNLGGGISSTASSLALVNCTISDNIARDGGGIYAVNGTVSVTNCTISNNLAQVSDFPVPSGGNGGGIYSSGAHLSLFNCTFAHNTASHGAGAFVNGSVIVTNCTFSQNSATDGTSSGLASEGSELRVDSCTFYQNQGAIFLDATTTLAIQNTILQFSGSNFSLGGLNPSQITDNGYNLSDKNDALLTQSSDQLATDANLGLLRNNGGPTFTHALFPGSPAIDKGSPQAPLEDQRGLVRNGPPDIGAFEFAGLLPVSLGNISTRGMVGIGDEVMIGGFTITGTSNKTVLLRAIGPSLSNPPINLTGTLQDPTLSLFNSSLQPIKFNDNWAQADNASSIPTNLQPSNALESAILISLAPGAYTAIVSGLNGGTGIGLVEVFDLDATLPSKLYNISTRGLVETGDGVLIGGFIVKGQENETVVVRAIGPSLGAPPINLPNVLQNPTLSIFNDQGGVIQSNDDWQSDQRDAIIATGLQPSNPAESAIVKTLMPGNYTAIVSGLNGATGIALVEVFGLN